jgi:hypothetical protein
MEDSFFGDQTLKKSMVTKKQKKGKLFWKSVFGHFFCPFFIFPKKSWIKKSVFYIINGLTYLKNPLFQKGKQKKP